jgi:hypothetical protein
VSSALLRIEVIRAVERGLPAEHPKPVICCSHSTIIGIDDVVLDAAMNETDRMLPLGRSAPTWLAWSPTTSASPAQTATLVSPSLTHATEAGRNPALDWHIGAPTLSQ